MDSNKQKLLIINILEPLINKLLFNNQIIEYTKTTANVCMFAAAILVSVSINMSLHFFPYFLFLMSHLLWGLCAIKMNEPKLLYLNFFMMCLDFFAIYIRVLN